MKRSLSWLLAALLFISCGGGDNATGPAGNNNPRTATPSTPGTPDGASTSKTIGAGGGLITSPDGNFTLTIPAGALSSDTLVTVQPISNTAHGGIGGGYRLTPQGLHFNVPVSLAFKVALSDLAGSNADFIDVATQDNAGLWYILKHRTYDDVTNTITVTTTHFSDYSQVEGLQIRPASANTTPYGKVNLTVNACYSQTYTGDDDNLAALVYTCDGDAVPLGTFSNWSVNGVKGGNATVGSVQETGALSARYTAPPSVPSSNPVAVSVMARGRRSTQTLVSNITIGSTWYGTVVMTQGNAKSEATVEWALIANYAGIETYRATGLVGYTPETDYGPSCTFVSMDPRNAVIETDHSALFIDSTGPTVKAYGYGQMTQTATTCFTCEGWNQPQCNTEALPGWFAADSLAVTNDGTKIDYQATDNTASPPVSITVHFTKGTPPAALAARRDR